MLMDNKKSNLSISSNKNSMAGENITGEEMENKNNIKENKNKNIKESGVAGSIPALGIEVKTSCFRWDTSSGG